MGGLTPATNTTAPIRHRLPDFFEELSGTPLRQHVGVEPVGPRGCAPPLGLTARIQRFGGYATDEVASRPSRSTPATTGQDLRVREAVTRAHHEECARVVAALTRRFGNLDIAEEAARDLRPKCG
ncbi:hypothetical protein C1I99_04655 [Micromonospora deserti]|uniref:Uncharacterized protein n=1 Tax=Micromonospora deserti TaxID=2070366 RepID=A0A2W2D9E3_9ACTN|nr:hypothetical protein C1I99_04655 [Micromonospora deserti]